MQTGERRGLDRNAVVQTIIGAAASVALLILLNFVADVKSDQTLIASRFEERTGTNNKEIEIIKRELDLLRGSDQRQRETTAKYELYMENLQAFSASYENLNNRLVSLEARLEALMGGLEKIQVTRLISRLEILERTDVELRDSIKEFHRLNPNLRDPRPHPGQGSP